nr:type I secretion C-terminal target domain-containing protein [Halomonas socia]
MGDNGDNSFESDGGDDLLIGDVGGKNLIIQPGQNYNISLIVDVSGSMSNASGTPGLSLMELTKQSLANLANQLEQHDGIVNVQLVPFSTHAETAVTIQNLDSDNVQQLIDAIDSLSADGGTNFMAAFQQAVAWFNGQNGQGQDDFENLTYFLTDGDPTYSYYNDQLYGPGTEPTYWVMQDSLQAFSELAGVSAVNAVGIGSDVSEQYLQYFTTNGVDGDANIFMDGKVSWGYANGMYRQFDWGEGEISAPAGSVSIVETAEDLDSALEGGVEYDELDELGDDILLGGDGDDIIFGDTVNTDHLEWTNIDTGKQFIAGEHDGLGYVGLVEYLKWEVNQGQAPDDQQIIEYVRDNWQSLADTDRDDGGNNILDGGAGDDILIGGSGDDLLIGGAGNDILVGGAGDDVFKWNFGDQGDADTPAHDIVTDFGNGQNTLDIADLLQDESEATIGQFVFAEQEGSDTVLYISSDGSLAGSKENADQTIRLEGKSFSDFGASQGDSADLIAKMIESGQLHIDQ